MIELTISELDYQKKGKEFISKSCTSEGIHTYLTPLPSLSYAAIPTYVFIITNMIVPLMMKVWYSHITYLVSAKEEPQKVDSRVKEFKTPIFQTTTRPVASLQGCMSNLQLR